LELVKQDPLRWYHIVGAIGILAILVVGYKIYTDPDLRAKFEAFIADYGPAMFAGVILASVSGVFSGAVGEIIKEVLG